MPVEVILPKVDMDMTHGTLATWHVAEGDMVKQGAALFDIETDKAAMEVEAPATGSLHHISAGPGDKVPVGTVVAWLYAEGETVGERPADAAPSVADDKTNQTNTADIGAAGTADPAQQLTPQERRQDGSSPSPALGGRHRATPAARAAMRANALDAAEVPGSGPRGRIQRDDVEAFLESRQSAPVAAPHAGCSPQNGPLAINRRDGEGMPLVLIHGLTADSQSWAPLEKALRGKRPLIRIDLPGHGRSPRRRISNFAALARMMAEAFDAATDGWESVHLLGHSLGGALGLAIADIRPRRVRSLTAIAPAGLGPEIDADALSGIARARSAESLAPWLRRLTATPEAISDDYARAAMRQRTDPALRACQLDMAAALFPDGVQAFDLRPALSRLEVHTTLIWGRKDQILPHRQALAAHGDFAIHFLGDIGHIPQFECPDRIAAIIGRQMAAAEAPN